MRKRAGQREAAKGSADWSAPGTKLFSVPALRHWPQGSMGVIALSLHAQRTICSSSSFSVQGCKIEQENQFR